MAADYENGKYGLFGTRDQRRIAVWRPQYVAFSDLFPTRQGLDLPLSCFEGERAFLLLLYRVAKVRSHKLGQRARGQFDSCNADWSCAFPGPRCLA